MREFLRDCNEHLVSLVETRSARYGHRIANLAAIVNSNYFKAVILNFLSFFLKRDRKIHWSCVQINFGTNFFDYFPLFRLNFSFASFITSLLSLQREFCPILCRSSPNCCLTFVHFVIINDKGYCNPLLRSILAKSRNIE